MTPPRLGAGQKKFRRRSCRCACRKIWKQPGRRRCRWPGYDIAVAIGDRSKTMTWLSCATTRSVSSRMPDSDGTASATLLLFACVISPAGGVEAPAASACDDAAASPSTSAREMHALKQRLSATHPRAPDAEKALQQTWSHPSRALARIDPFATARDHRNECHGCSSSPWTPPEPGIMDMLQLKRADLESWLKQRQTWPVLV